VFSAQVKKEIGELQGWWAEQEYPDAKPKRRDLRVGGEATNRGTVHHVIPVFSTVVDSSLINAAKQRLDREPFHEGSGRRFVVVPPLSRARQDPEVVPATDIAIVTLKDLLTLLTQGQ
jgi:hypothetical protein